MKYMSGKKKIILAAMTLVIALAAVGCGKEEPAGPVLDQSKVADEAKNYILISAKIEDITLSSDEAGGKFYPDSQSVLFQQPKGAVEEIIAKIGKQVKTGDKLVKLSNEYSEAHLKKLESELEQTIKNFENEKKQRKKDTIALQTQVGAVENIFKDLKQNKDTTTAYNGVEDKIKLAWKDMEIGNARLEKAGIDYNQFIFQTEKKIADLQEEIAEYKVDYQNQFIIATCEGTVQDISHLEKGDAILEGDYICNIQSEDRFFICMDDRENLLRYNTRVSFYNEKDESKELFSGHVLSSPDLCGEAFTGNENVLISIDDPSGEIPTGKLNGTWDYVKIEQVLTLDKLAVQNSDANGTYVEVMEEGRIIAKYIECVEEDDKVWVRSGLSGNEKIILNGTSK